MDSLYQVVLKNMFSLTIPNKWFSSTELSTKNVLVPTFHKLGFIQSKYKIFIEKQLIITEGTSFFNQYI